MNNKGRPNVENVTVIESYRIRWTDGEIWRAVREISTDGSWIVTDPQGKTLDKDDPMRENIIRVIFGSIG